VRAEVVKVKARKVAKEKEEKGKVAKVGKAVATVKVRVKAKARKVAKEKEATVLTKGMDILKTI